MRRFFAVFALCLLGTAYAGADVPFEARIDTFAVASDCSPACVNLDITGVGQARQGGRVTIDGPSQVSFINGAQAGESTMTTADGSTLFFEFEGCLRSQRPECDVLWFLDRGFRHGTIQGREWRRNL